MSWGRWLPTTQQMSNAAQMRPGAYRVITMRQALGMIVVSGLVAGFLPFLANWALAARYDTVLPLAQSAQSSLTLTEQATFLGTIPGLNYLAIVDFYTTSAGLDQTFPGWLAGGLSAFGNWISLPINWLGIWIVYGAFVALINRLMGATPTLQHFYGATGFAAVPLSLLTFSVIPCLGPLVTLGSILWATAIYVRANKAVTGLDLLKSVAAVLLPAGLLILIALFGIGALMISSSSFLL